MISDGNKIFSNIGKKSHMRVCKKTRSSVTYYACVEDFFPYSLGARLKKLQGTEYIKKKGKM